MKKVKFFFKVFWRSLTDFKYYPEILKTKFSFSLKYLFFLLFILALVRGIVLATQLAIFIPRIPNLTQKIEEIARELYPEELVVEVKDGQVSTNVVEPYAIPLPEEVLQTFSTGISEPRFKNLAVINTRASAEDYPEYESLVLVTKNALVFLDNDTYKTGGYRVYPLSQFQSEGKLNRQTYDYFLSLTLPYLKYVKTAAYLLLAVALILLPPVGASVNLGLKMFFLLWASLLVWLISRIMKKGLGYKEIYRLSLHAITPAVLAAFVWNLVTLNPLAFWIFFIIYLIFIFLVLNQFKKTAPALKKTASS